MSETVRRAAEEARQSAADARAVLKDMKDMARRVRLATEKQEAAVEEFRRWVHDRQREHS
jgi:hypothetical protein